MYSFCILLPLSLPRTINQLRPSSVFNVLCSVYLCIAVVLVFFTDRSVVPDIQANLRQMEAVKLSYQGLVSTFPLVIFAYMYQVNIPMIYRELEVRNQAEMAKVVAGGTGAAVLLYVTVGLFGYAIFQAPPASSQLCS